MTKQTDPAMSATDRPAPTLNKAFEVPQDLDSAPVQPFKLRQNRLSLEGLSPSEAYLNGDLVICVALRPRKGSCLKHGRFGLHLADKLNSADHRPVVHLKPGDLCAVFRREEDHVFVGNVEQVDGKKVASIASRVRLYLVKDMPNDCLAWRDTKLGMTLDGTFKVLPAALFSKGELDALPVGMVDYIATVRLDENTVGMIKGGSEIVQGIAKDGWGVTRERGPEWPAGVPPFCLLLSKEGAFVLSDMRSEELFQLTDVYLGPFGL